MAFLSFFNVFWLWNIVVSLNRLQNDLLSDMGKQYLLKAPISPLMPNEPRVWDCFTQNFPIRRLLYLRKNDGNCIMSDSPPPPPDAAVDLKIEKQHVDLKFRRISSWCRDNIKTATTKRYLGFELWNYSWLNWIVDWIPWYFWSVWSVDWLVRLVWLVRLMDIFPLVIWCCIFSRILRQKMRIANCENVGPFSIFMR